jgi:hypothetical protein
MEAEAARKVRRRTVISSKLEGDGGGKLEPAAPTDAFANCVCVERQPQVLTSAGLGKLARFL